VEGGTSRAMNVKTDGLLARDDSLIECAGSTHAPFPWPIKTQARFLHPNRVVCNEY